MDCPKCGGSSRIYQTETMEFVIRYRVCRICRNRFITTEVIDYQSELESHAKQSQLLASEYWQDRKKSGIRPFSDTGRKLSHV